MYIDIRGLRITENNEYGVLYTTDNSGSPNKTIIWDISISDTPILVTTTYESMRSFASINAFNNKVYGVMYYSGSSTDLKIIVYTLKKGEDGNIKYSEEKKASIPFNTYSSGTIYTTMCTVTNDGKKLIFVAGSTLLVPANRRTLPHIFVLDMEEILSLPSGSSDYTEVSILQDYYTANSIEINYCVNILSMFKNKNSTKIYVMISSSRGYYPSEQKVYGLTNVLDEGNVIAVIYKNEYFTKVTPHALSAGGPDVRAGKTFIGWMGYPETGTMEVE